VRHSIWYTRNYYIHLGSLTSYEGGREKPTASIFQPEDCSSRLPTNVAAWHHIPDDSTVHSAWMSWNFKPYVQWRISEKILVLVHYYEAIKHMLLHLTVVIYFTITYHLTCENSGLWCHIGDTFNLLECYTAYAGNCLLTFWIAY